jgi:hypothetical protein
LPVVPFRRGPQFNLPGGYLAGCSGLLGGQGLPGTGPGPVHLWPGPASDGRPLSGNVALGHLTALPSLNLHFPTGLALLTVSGGVCLGIQVQLDLTGRNHLSRDRQIQRRFHRL